MAKKFRTGEGSIGRKLTPSEVDDNFRDTDLQHATAISAANSARSIVHVVANEAAMLAIVNPNIGHEAKRLDNTSIYKLSALPATDLLNWVFMGKYNGGVTIDDAATSSTDKTWSIDKIKAVIPTLSSSGANVVPVILMIGESNSGGIALNSDASEGELGEHPSVQIMHPATLEFTSLIIGDSNQNNLLDHFGLTDIYGEICHGWELQLAAQVEAGLWPSDRVYLIKAGQGGSMVSDWDNVGGAFFTKFATRISAAKTHFAANDQIPLFYIWYTHGINDAVALTNIVAFKASMKNFWANIRSYTGFAPIAATEIPSIYEPYNVAIRELIDEDKFASMVDTTGLGMRDTNHWNYSGVKAIADRMRSETIVRIGAGIQYVLSQNYALSTRPVGGEVLPPAPDVWTSKVNVSEGLGGLLAYSPGAGPDSGAVLIQSIDSTQPFEFHIHYDSFYEQSGVVVFLEDNSTPLYVWGASSVPFVSGVYRVGEGSNVFYKTLGRGVASTYIGAIGSEAMIVKVVGDGADVTYEWSGNAGATWNAMFVHEAVLSGLSEIYLKVIFAIQTAPKNILVERIV
jgi:hypothetical protein